MDASLLNDLDPLQNWVVEKFHFSAILAGVSPEATPLGLLAAGPAGDTLLDHPALVEMAGPLGLSRESLRHHLVAAYRSIEGQ